ncbi:MAG: bifunctional DNA primase/polymerase, partial [Armatimonadetes bacterium]|nr:bifunctional DNA primase/polymerase [Armatimonadota bacterium]
MMHVVLPLLGRDERKTLDVEIAAPNPFEVAKILLARGISVIPVKAGDKRPKTKWKKYIEQYPSEDDIARWFLGKSWSDIGIAVVCGKISKIVVLDIEKYETYEEIINKAKEELQGDILDKLMKTFHVATGKGAHIYIRVDGEDERVFRHRRKTAPDGTLLYETRGEGQYVVAPYSLHPSGVHYVPINGSIDTVFTVEEALELLNWLFKPEKPKSLKTEPGTMELTNDQVRKIVDLIREYRVFPVEGFRRLFLEYLMGATYKSGYTV